MVLLTMIARLADGLPLAASMQEDEQVEVLASLSVSPFSVFRLLLIRSVICSEIG